MITIDNFESKISDTILQRGKRYFKEKRVCELTEIENDVWVALVDGSEAYQTRVQINPEGGLKLFCDCPYDYGPYCKHQVAVLYTLRNNQLDENEEDDFKINTVRKARKSKTRKKTRKVDEILADLSKEGLIEIILKSLKSRCDLKSLILAQDMAQAGSSSKSDYKKLIKQNVRMAADRHGFLGYWESGQAMVNIEFIYEEAKENIESNPKQTMIIAEALIEVLLKTLESADDSNGEIGGGIEEAFELLAKASENLPEAEQEKFFLHCLECYQKKEFKDWGFEDNFLDLATELCPKDKKDFLFKTLDEILEESNKDSWNWTYKAESIAKKKWDIVKKDSSEKEQEDFLGSHLNFHDIREKAINYYLEKNDFEKAKKLAKEGADLTLNEYSGLHKKYWKWLLEIAKKEKDEKEIIKLTKKLFYLTNDFDYYENLKKTFSEKEWKEFLNEVFEKKEKQVILDKIYKREGMWEELLDYVLKSNFVNDLEKYEKDLKLQYPKELALKYSEFIQEKLHSPYGGAPGRKVYKEVCRYLRRMKKLKSEKEVEELIEKLKEQYKTRKALLEELERV